ncbi:MAG TPA: hypothetical protein VGW75_13160 [Solirubrobacteraceae bacterium]|nr:hypothetical protein [Solirubrobacteraceae bacterium]
MAARPQGTARGLATRTWSETAWRDQVERLVADDLVKIAVVPAGEPIVPRDARARSDAAVDVTQAARRTFRTADRASISIDAG